MNKELIEKIKRELDLAEEGLEEYAETLDDTWVCGEHLDNIRKLLNEDESEEKKEWIIAIKENDSASGAKFTRFYGTTYQTKNYLLRLIDKDVIEDWVVNKPQSIEEVKEENGELNAWVSFEEYWTVYTAKELSKIEYHEIP